MLNVSLIPALADVEALAPAKVCYEKGLSGMEEEFARYMQAVRLLERCGIPSEHLTQEKTESCKQKSIVEMKKVPQKLRD